MSRFGSDRLPTTHPLCQQACVVPNSQGGDTAVAFVNPRDACPQISHIPVRHAAGAQIPERGAHQVPHDAHEGRKSGLALYVIQRQLSIVHGSVLIPTCP